MRFHALIIRITLPKVKSIPRLGVILPVVLGLLCSSAWAAFESDLNGPRATGLGGAGVAVWGDVWAPMRNPALAAVTIPQVGLYWSQQFGLPELTREAVLVTSTVRGQSWAVRGSSFGSDLYRETEFGLALAWSLHSTIAFGIEASGRWLQIQDYSRGQAISLAAGLSVRPTEHVTLGANWRNFNEPRLSGYDDRLGELLTVGAAVEVGDDGLIAADVVQETRFRAEYRIGAEARVLSPLWIRLGIRAEPVRPSGGVEIAAGQWHFFYAADLHPDLGASHELGLAVRFHK